MAPWNFTQNLKIKLIILALKTNFKLQNNHRLPEGYVMEDTLRLLILEELQVECINPSHDINHTISYKHKVEDPRRKPGLHWLKPLWIQ